MKIDLTLELTNICNYKCDMCFLSEKDVIRPQHMSIDIVKKFINELNESGYTINVLRIFWAGEPTLNPEFCNILNLLSKENKINCISFDTNGSLLDEKIRQCILEASKYKPIRIIISVDSFDKEHYEKIRKNGNIEKVKENIKELALSIDDKSNIEIALQFVVHPLNKDELGDFISESKILLGQDISILLNESMAHKTGVNIRPLTVQDEEMGISQEDANLLYIDTLKRFNIIDKESNLKVESQGGGGLLG
ncbi:MAG: hypothetical protein C0601_13055 [Candidatus Muiribacterium halophilum]|uniref:Radical SAM core domain-containing protein n=1 Tax=Muiribacterium halophilum TaxID=2053465 RepID=A0A2N5Z9P2_MUIH1|nr:MAG: hypothetical protein C0601_13055 [Candidatus Muirbacterium halophilum]